MVAPATAAGAAGLHVIRLSGPRAIALAETLFQGRKSLLAAQPRTLHYGSLTDGAGRVLDDVVVALFRAPHSYTREDVVEISTHGSDYIVGEALAALVAHGARLAGPGEFTQRAFLNGALDLAQAEAVADVIAADSALAHRVAVQQLRGGVSNQLRELRQELIDFAALLELELDFAEEDVEFANRPALTALLGRVLDTVEELRATFGLGNAIKNGVVTVIAGRPNAGKSTLLNALVGEERAIVSAIAGTTRDLIEDEVVLGGLRFRFVDTAGLRETTDEIEAMGVARTRARAGQAALLVYVFDLTTATRAEVAADVAELLEGREAPVLLVGNKADAATAATALPGGGLQISAHNPADIHRLRAALLDTARAAGLDASSTATVITNARHHGALTRAGEAIRSVLTGLATGLGTELVAYDLRAALNALGEITGDVTPEDLLGSIFGRFCIGK
ncbi:MAG: tRNA uridine-5-carboxymethylaminomethyl(34) synthesis GTPase MnmE [Hymenobacteraceae bacterium]|nr:tRNA uridine-5-carboxymethylaminomethyl(34) synthesis GTPase MnmE [Hymenobacteraceae bacterium]